MAEKKGWDKQVVIGEVEKSASTIIRVSYVESEAMKNDDGTDEIEKFRAVDIREMYKRKGDTEWKYSAKGMTLPIENLFALKKLLIEASIEATKAENAEKPKKRKTTTRKKKVGAK